MTVSPATVFQIRDWVDFDSKGRSQCPCCSKSPKDKTLSLVPNSEYGYKCFRGCTPAEIREALGAPPPGHRPLVPPPSRNQKAPPPPKDYTVGQDYVDRAARQLLGDSSEVANQSRNWLFSRGIVEEDIRRLRLGLGTRVIIPNEEKPEEKEIYGAICIFIPIPDHPGRYYVKKRVVPWLNDEQRPDYLGKWCQYGVPATVWFTHLPDGATETWFCEGEWDAIRLAQLVRQQEAKIVIACSTAGCGCVPKPEELARLPGTVTIFYDRNDKPKADGTQAGEEGAKKLAISLNGRGRIAQVPMPESCEVNGWDVSNALDAGYGWSDFEQAAATATTVVLSEANGTGLGSEANGTGLGSEANGTGLGSKSNGTGLGGESNGTGLGGESNGTGLGGESNASGLGGESNASGLGGESNGTGLGGESNGTGLGNPGLGSGDGSGPESGGAKGKVPNHPGFIPLNNEQLLAEINQLIDQDLPQSQLSALIPALAQRSGYSERSVWKIYHHRLTEIEIEEEREATAAAIDALLLAKEASLDLRDLLPGNLTEPLLKFATWLQVRPESLLLTLLTTTSSLHHSQTISWLNRDWDFSVKPNLYSAIVAPPSQKKSPIVRAISRKPLKILEKKARQAWKEQQQQYKEQEQFYQSLDKEERREQFPEGLPQAPPNRRLVYSFTKNTSEGLRNQVEAYPNQGLLAIPDELAGLLKSANAYRGGRGSDEEDLLSYYDGTGETVLRAEGLAGDFDDLLLSILGTIQPKVLQGFLSDCEDKNGRWARFMFVNQPLVPSTMSADGGSFDLTPLLADLYEKVNQLPPMEYLPDREAFKYYCAVYNELERRRVVDPSPAMSAIWGKAEGRIGKIATNLHAIHELMGGRIPGQDIPKARYVEATQIALFFIQQVFSLYNELGEADALATHLTKVIELSRQKGLISARDVQLGYDRKSRPSPNEVRSWFRELEAMGKGVTQGEGRYLKFNCQVVGDVGGTPTNSPTTVTPDLSSFQPNVEFVGECGVFLKKSQEEEASVGSQQAATASQVGAQLPYPYGSDSFNHNFSEISPTTPTNSTNGYKVDGVRDVIVGELPTNPPTNSTNGQKVDGVREVIVGEPPTNPPTNSTNGQKVDGVRDVIVGELPTNPPTNATNGHEVDGVRDSIVGELPTNAPTNSSNSHSGVGNLSANPPIPPTNWIESDNCLGDETNFDSEGEVESVRGNGLSPLTEAQQLLLMCQTLADLLDVKAMYPAAEVAVAYNSLNSCDRRQIRNLILREAGPISVDGQAMSPCQLLSSLIGEAQDNINVGDKVDWHDCPGHLESWSPFEVLEVCDGGWVRLDIISELVPLCELRRVKKPG